MCMLLLVAAGLALAATAGAEHFRGGSYRPSDLPRIVDPKPVLPPRTFDRVDPWLWPVPKHDPAFTLLEWLGEDPTPQFKAVAAQLRRDGFQIGRHKVWHGYVPYHGATQVEDVVFAFLFRDTAGAHAALGPLAALSRRFTVAQRRTLPASGLGEESINEWTKDPDENVTHLWRRRNLVLLNIAHCESWCDFPGVIPLALKFATAFDARAKR